MQTSDSLFEYSDPIIIRSHQIPRHHEYHASVVKAFWRVYEYTFTYKFSFARAKIQRPICRKRDDVSKHPAVPLPSSWSE